MFIEHQRLSAHPARPTNPLTHTPKLRALRIRLDQNFAGAKERKDFRERPTRRQFVNLADILSMIIGEEVID
jgi:hypothetical protein